MIFEFLAFLFLLVGLCVAIYYYVKSSFKEEIEEKDYAIDDLQRQLHDAYNLIVKLKTDLYALYELNGCDYCD